MPEKPPADDHYFMNIAIAVRAKAKCKGRRVGAVLVKHKRIISTGYNGTPEGFPNCTDGGCVRCANTDTKIASQGYDVCICVHAEENSIVSAARFGIAIEGATAYSTMRPCFICSKQLLQAKIQRVIYLHDWQHSNPELNDQYNSLQDKFPSGVTQITNFVDPEDDWANNREKVAAK